MALGQPAGSGTTRTIILAVTGLVVAAIAGIVVVTILAPGQALAVNAVIVGAVLTVTTSLFALAKAADASDRTAETGGKVDALHESINGRITQLLVEREEKLRAEQEAERNRERAAFLARVQAGEDAGAVLKDWAEKGTIQ